MRGVGGLALWVSTGCAMGTSDGASGSFGPLGDDGGTLTAGAGTLDPDVPDDGGGSGDADDGDDGDDGMVGTSAPPATDGGDDTADDASASDDSTLPGECGNGLLEADEDCDGRDLGDASCADFDFSHGSLVCGGDCHLLTDGCFSCGDGTVAPSETCDGTEFGGETCASLGFAGGTLGCTADCQSIVTTGCQALPSCGDGMLNGGEQCDAAALGGQTCITQGFDLGQLACSGSCTLDTSGCSFDTENCGGQGDFCLFDENDLQSTCCPPGVEGNVLGICNVAVCV
jgi:hypothetical protein